MPIIKMNESYLPEGCILLENDIILEISRLELLEGQMDTFLNKEYDEEDYLNESYIVDDMLNFFKDIITTLTKGKDVVRKHHYEAAQQANDYSKEIDKVINNDKSIKGVILDVMEYYTETIYTGSGYISTDYYRNPIIYGTVINFDRLKSELLKISNKDSGIKDKAIGKMRLMHGYKNTYLDAIKYTPTIVKRRSKTTVWNHVKRLNKIIIEAKEKSEELNKSMNDTVNEIKKAQDMLEKFKQNPPDSKDLSFFISNFKKAIKYQTGITKHDLRLVDKFNVMIVRQSHSLLRAILKYSK